MNRAGFWSIIEESLADWNSDVQEGNTDRQKAALRDLLSVCPTPDVVSFDRHFAQVSYRAYRWDLWAAARIILGGCSDDGFMDFREGLVSMGRSVCEAALADPESLVDVVGGNRYESLICEGFSAVPYEVLESRAEEGVLVSARSQLPHPKRPTGRRRWEENELPSLFPRLWAVFRERAAEQGDRADER